MKNLLLNFVALSLSCQVFAVQPKKGDAVRYIAQAAIQTDSKYEIKDFDSNAGIYKLKVAEKMGDSGWAHWNSQIALAEIQAYYNSYADCVSLNGKMETVKVSAGTFKTCSLEEATSEKTETVWYAEIPFGFVKSEIVYANNHQKVTTYLKSFKTGK